MKDNETMKQVWYAVRLTVKAEAEEAAHYALAQAGAAGSETNALQKDVRAEEAEPLVCVPVIGYFEDAPNEKIVRRELETAWRIYDLSDDVLLDFEIYQVENRDWLAEWKASWQPTRAGRFIVAPSWIETTGDETSPHVLRIEPGMAFGTGTHATTRLCLEIISRYDKSKKGFGSFLDVGCGTGILAIAARLINDSARIEACDTDAPSIEIAGENARLNGVEPHIDFRVGSITEMTALADVVCANLTADVILPLLPQLIKLACGELILSGILDVQVDEVQSGLRACGAISREIIREGEWVALVV